MSDRSVASKLWALGVGRVETQWVSAASAGRPHTKVSTKLCLTHSIASTTTNNTNHKQV